ncbi:Shkbp1 [Symbiodinium sp. CCMP2592]|nr:Shkbp1 [Symbiodinium sp. CCMP2592]
MALRVCKRRRVARPPTSIKLNIGGEKLIEVSPDIFDILGENRLSSQLSGRCEAQHDANGNIFLDYSPEVFMPLVEWLRDLRDMRDAEPNVIVQVLVQDERRYSWIRMMRAFSVDVRHLAMAGVQFHELVAVGYSGTQLRSVFKLDCTLQLALGVSVEELQQAGFSEEDIRGAEAILREYPDPLGNTDYIFRQDPPLVWGPWREYLVPCPFTYAGE